MKKEILTRAFTPQQIKTRPGQGGKSLNYIETHAVIARLNEAADFEWSFEVVKHDVLADEVIVLGKLTIDGISKMAFGGSSVTRDNSGKEASLADDLKAAMSDAIKKTASLFGIGLELYGAPAPAAAPAPARAEEQPRPSITSEERLTTRQLGAIHAACRRRGWSPAYLTALVGERFGRNNPQALSRAEASNLITELTNGH